MKFATTVVIDTDELVEELATEHAQAMALIKALDLAIADYAFTEELARYFVQQLADEYIGSQEKFDLNSLAPVIRKKRKSTDKRYSTSISVIVQ